MKAPTASPVQANLNHLRRGSTYRAHTTHGRVTGEYLGMESLYGEFAILLRHEDGTDSVPIDTLVSIRQAA